MQRKKAAVSSHGPQGTKDEVRLARGSRGGPREILEDFLTTPPEDPVAEALARFPGDEPKDDCLRSAYMAIVAARLSSASAAEILAQLRNVIRDDPEELEDSRDAGGTMVEWSILEVLVELEMARRACRRAVSMVRRTRARRPKRLRMASGDA
jgi:hypothetical protein